MVLVVQTTVTGVCSLELEVENPPVSMSSTFLLCLEVSGVMHPLHKDLSQVPQTPESAQATAKGAPWNVSITALLRSAQLKKTPNQISKQLYLEKMLSDQEETKVKHNNCVFKYWHDLKTLFTLICSFFISLE